MNIGVFDSGLGGLIIAKSLIDAMPEYDFVYMGDTANVPYGQKTTEIIHKLTTDCINRMFEYENCGLIVVACNTASVASLRKLQQIYMPSKFPNRKILGVIAPTVEEVIKHKYKNIGLIATQSTVDSSLYPEKFKESNYNINITSLATPILVQLIEKKRDDLAPYIIDRYIKQLSRLNPDIEALILGCTHYPYYKDLIGKSLQKFFKNSVPMISQDEIIADSLKLYLNKHKEIENLLTKNENRKFYVTKINQKYKEQSTIIMGYDIDIRQVSVE